MSADEILVMDKGCIVERGRHDHLLTLEGHYAQMWRLQQQGETNAHDGNLGARQT